MKKIIYLLLILLVISLFWLVWVYKFYWPMTHEGILSYPTHATSHDASTMIPTQLIFISPKSGDIWHIGQTYKVKWNGGGERVRLILVSENIEKNIGASASKLWTSGSAENSSMENFGVYDFVVYSNLASTTDEYRWFIDDSIGNYVWSKSFKIIP